jgi:aspartokinase
MECPVVRAVSSLVNLVKFTVAMELENTSLFLKEIANAGIALEMLQVDSSSPDNKCQISFLCGNDRLALVQNIVEKYQENTLENQCSILKNKGILSVVGLGLKGHNIASIGGILVNCLHQNRIPIEGMLVGDIQICLLLDMSYVEEAVRIAHKELGLDID